MFFQYYVYIYIDIDIDMHVYLYVYLCFVCDAPLGLRVFSHHAIGSKSTAHFAPSLARRAAAEDTSTLPLRKARTPKGPRGPKKY